MHRTRLRATIAGAAGLLLALPAAAQPPAAAASELYHIHVVQAAPGKLGELIETYLKGPAPEAGDPQVDPFVLRHREGGEWDLVVITPLGADYAATAAAPPPAVQKFNETVAGLAAWHADTLAAGPPWAAVQKALLPTRSAAPAVFVVSDYRSLPGHRPQLRQTLDRIAADSAGRSAVFTHVEGSPWNFFTVTRHDSWAAMGEATQPVPSGQADVGMDLRQHLAVHHDTVAVYVGGGEARR
jgi:hypothetical protein